MSELPESTLSAVTRGPEGITATPGGGVMAAGPDAVGLFRLVAIRSALRFEVTTGMRMSRVSALRAANEVLGTKYRRKQHALDHLDTLLSSMEEDGDE